jgi:hypothetical protein
MDHTRWMVVGRDINAWCGSKTRWDKTAMMWMWDGYKTWQFYMLHYYNLSNLYTFKFSNKCISLSSLREDHTTMCLCKWTPRFSLFPPTLLCFKPPTTKMTPISHPPHTAHAFSFQQIVWHRYLLLAWQPVIILWELGTWPINPLWKVPAFPYKYLVPSQQLY